MFFNTKKAPHKPGCMALHVVVAILLGIAVLVSLVGVYKAHFLTEGLAIGTSVGSFSLIALSLSLMVFMKQVKACGVKCEVCKP